MTEYYLLNRETISIGGIEWNITTHSVDMTAWHLAYTKGYRVPNYPVPAIPLQVKYDYIGCVNIDDVSDPDDPIIVWMYDSWTGFNPEPALR